MNVKEIMTENPGCCRRESSLKEVAKMMVTNDCGCIPVVDDKSKPVGIITDRDIAVRTVAEGKNPLEMTAGDAMTNEVYSVSAESTVEDCCNLMEEKQVRRVIVTDENGECCGIVAQADVAAYAPKQQTAEVVRQVSKAN